MVRYIARMLERKAEAGRQHCGLTACAAMPKAAINPAVLTTGFGLSPGILARI